MRIFYYFEYNICHGFWKPLSLMSAWRSWCIAAYLFCFESNIAVGFYIYIYILLLISILYHFIILNISFSSSIHHMTFDISWHVVCHVNCKCEKNVSIAISQIMHFSNCTKYLLLWAKNLFAIDMFPLGIVSICAISSLMKMHLLMAINQLSEKKKILALCAFCERDQLMTQKIC